MFNSNGKSANTFHVLTYHRVAELQAGPHLNPGLISATPALFAQQMMFLKENFQVIAMADLLQSVRNGCPLPKRAVLITFDDAYRDFGENAWPVLKKWRLPVTVFVPTAYPDRPENRFWWDQLHQAIMHSQRQCLQLAELGDIPLASSEQRRQGLKCVQTWIKNKPHTAAMALVDEIYQQAEIAKNPASPVHRWEELRKLASDGVTLGAHTRTHPILTRLPLQAAREEIIQSQNDLKKEIGSVLPIFSYPDGGHHDGIVNILKEEGFLLGFNGPAGHNDLSTADLFRIRRINITPRSTELVFRLRLTRWFSSVERFRMRKRIQEITSTIEFEKESHDHAAN
ncbi:MAG: polysaccharide deacetylase family protein [bacterium]